MLRFGLENDPRRGRSRLPLVEQLTGYCMSRPRFDGFDSLVGAQLCHIRLQPSNVRRRSAELTERVRAIFLSPDEIAAMNRPNPTDESTPG